MQTHIHRETMTHTDTQTHMHSWCSGCVWRGSLWGVGPGWPVGIKTCMCSQVQIRTTQEVWSKNNTHRVMDPLNYSFVYQAGGSVGFVQNGECVYTDCVCALYCTRVDVCNHAYALMCDYFFPHIFICCAACVFLWMGSLLLSASSLLSAWAAILHLWLMSYKKVDIIVRGQLWSIVVLLTQLEPR